MRNMPDSGYFPVPVGLSSVSFTEMNSYYPRQEKHSHSMTGSHAHFAPQHLLLDWRHNCWMTYSSLLQHLIGHLDVLNSLLKGKELVVTAYGLAIEGK